MNCLIVEDGVVVNTAIWDQCPDGWVDNITKAGIWWIDNGDGTYSPPSLPVPDPLTIPQQIAELEGSVTARNLRGAVLGDQFAIDKIQVVEDQIKLLRDI